MVWVIALVVGVRLAKSVIVAATLFVFKLITILFPSTMAINIL